MDSQTISPSQAWMKEPISVQHVSFQRSAEQDTRPKTHPVPKLEGRMKVESLLLVLRE